MSKNANRHNFPLVSTFISFHARRRPDNVAVIRNGTEITYATLDRDLRAMTVALARFGLARQSVAAISHADLYIHLLIMLGFENLGVATGSYSANENANCHALLATADLVLTDRQVPPPAYRRRVTITEDWVQAALATPAPGRQVYLPGAPEDIVFILRSSGTTGQSKRMVMTRACAVARLRRKRLKDLEVCLDSRSRFLATMHFSVWTIVATVQRCLCLGGTFMFATDRFAAEVLAEYRPTHFMIMPFQLRLMLADLPPGGPLLPALTVQSMGAKLPADLRRLCLQKLAGRVVEAYGANEVGAIGNVDEAGILTVVPGLEVEVAGPLGEALPIGEIGGFRGDTIVSGYVDNEAATAEMFRDGWFYPGDLGAMVSPGHLRLIGRRADILNLDGRKIACTEVESRLLDLPAIRDVAVFQQNDSAGQSPILVCAVVEPNTDLRALGTSLRPILGFPFALYAVASIPRTPEGKIKREELRQALQHHLSAGRAMPPATAKEAITA
jgi:acyl-coenzyme A synthetase/AMP-(fatty) acid ligase